MHGSMKYEPIQGQGHELSSPPCTMGAGNWPLFRAQYLNLIGPDFSYLS